MTDPYNETRDDTNEGTGSGSPLQRVGRSIVQNPLKSVQVVFFLLVAIIVLQNLEPTSIDILFWSIASVPKLILIFGSMLVGATIWELARRLIR